MTTVSVLVDDIAPAIETLCTRLGVPRPRPQSYRPAARVKGVSRQGELERQRERDHGREQRAAAAGERLEQVGAQGVGPLQPVQGHDLDGAGAARVPSRALLRT
jgi:hypothetical protein